MACYMKAVYSFIISYDDSFKSLNNGNGRLQLVSKDNIFHCHSFTESEELRNTIFLENVVSADIPEPRNANQSIGNVVFRPESIQ